MDRAEQLAVLSGATADQWGLVTAAQAKELGLSAVQLLRLAEAGLLENVSRGVYLLSASGMPRHVDIKAAWLRLQPKEFAWDRPAGHPDSGVVSHASACQLHELGDIPAPEVEITVPRRRTTTEPFVRLRTAPLDPAEITVVDGLPVTTASRTITDLLQAKADGGHVGGVIAEAKRRDLIALDDLAERVQPYARKYGLKATATGRDLIDHLVEQAGESLRRQEVARASKEGFDAAVHLLAEHPDLAGYLARHTAGHQRTVKGEAFVAQLLSAQPANLALSSANTCLYGIVHAAILALGCSPALGFVHSGNQQALVYDIADLYKAELTIPLAFSLHASTNPEAEARRSFRDGLRLFRLLPRIVHDLQELLDPDGSREAPDPEEQLVDLWDPVAGPLPGGANHGAGS